LWVDRVLTPGDMARLHAASFTHPRPWSETEFAALLASEGAILVDEAAGFALGRAVAGEAELLTLAVAPEARRQGVARRLLADFLTEAGARNCRKVFLEVAADNAAALALYRAAGFAEAGRRRGYYTGPDGRNTDALVLSCCLPRALPDS
jgi:ribosomal-protein-alanine N-acetyltransferase